MSRALRASQGRTGVKTRGKRTDRQKVITKLDTLVSRIIRDRDAKCVVCGTTKNLTNGHIFSRASYSLRWDIRADGNCHTQCKGCNLRHEHDPYPYLSWYARKFGHDRLDILHSEWRSVAKWSTAELELMYQDMKVTRPGSMRGNSRT